MNEKTTITGEKSKNIFDPDPKDILRVASKTDAKKLAGAITAAMSDKGYVYLRCIGDGAIGSGMRACTIARGYLMQAAPVDPVLVSSFFVADINGNERTGLTLLFENR